MNKLIQYIAIPCIVMSMSSCRFSEECNYTGNVELIMDWESMWGDLLKPDSLTTLFYHNDRLSALRTLLGDTEYESIPSGEMEMIIYNQIGRAHV